MEKSTSFLDSHLQLEYACTTLIVMEMESLMHWMPSLLIQMSHWIQMVMAWVITATSSQILQMRVSILMVTVLGIILICSHQILNKPSILMAMDTEITPMAKTVTSIPQTVHNGQILTEMGTEIILKEHLQMVVHSSMDSRPRTVMDVQMEILMDIPIQMRIGLLNKVQMPFQI